MRSLFSRQYGQLPWWLPAVFAGLPGLSQEADSLQPSFYTIPDTAYYRVYPYAVTTRFYLSQKYTAFWIPPRNGLPLMRYRPNAPVNMGIGATYGIFTLNLAYGFDLFDRRDGARGRTRMLDLQTYAYGRRFVADLYGQFYRGLYLHPRGLAAEGAPWYTRPDLRIRLLGATGYHLFNGERFSMRASFLQHEWQQRSAGTWLAGGAAFYGQVRADSTLVPTQVSGQRNYPSEIRFVDIGPGGGYAYTYVWRRHWFATLAAVTTLSVTFARETDGNRGQSTVSISPNPSAKAALGYNSDQLHVALIWVHQSVRLRGEELAYRLPTGNLRLHAGWRIPASARMRQRLEPLQPRQ